MSLITLQNALLSYGPHALLDHADFSLEENERIGLIGRNGAGKSSLLKILAGTKVPDDGAIQWQGGTMPDGQGREVPRMRLIYVAQEPEFSANSNVFDVVSEGVAQAKALRAEYEAMASLPEVNIRRLDALQTQIEALDGWTWEQRVTETLQRLHLDPQPLVERLSGGMKKRVALARALVSKPDVLLLDEPTNHLDMDSILWLEELLNNFAGAIVLISHDRTFLDQVTTRIVELDRGKLVSYPGNFSKYQELKAEQLAQEATLNAKADKLLSQEEAWMRQGIEARRTRSVDRINRLKVLRQKRQERRNALGQVRISVDSGISGGKIVAELKNVSKAFSEHQVIDDFSITILRGDKVGLIGPNGAGKSTLLKIILGELKTDQGHVRLGTNLNIAYFDQLREKLDENATLIEFISPGSEWIEIGKQRKHVMSYLADFLFSPERARAPISTLSGGERNRLLLARLLARPANILVLDEPTNDLDIDTIELLEELLQSYDGTVFLVSHDRMFLENIITSTIAYESHAKWREYEGGYEDWKIQSERAAAIKANQQAKTQTTQEPIKQESQKKESKASKKLSYNEQRELEQLPVRIDALEKEQAEIGKLLSGTEIYQQEPEKVGALQSRYAAIDTELENALERWEELANRA